MTRWMILLSTLLFVSTTWASDFYDEVQATPRPLPDAPYEPGPDDPIRSEPPREEFIPYTLGTGDTGRFGSKDSEFYPRFDLARVVSLRLVGSRNEIDVKEVKVLYADNMVERSLYTLQGNLRSGAMKEIALDGRPIYRIDISAKSERFWKKLGSYRVDIIAVR